MDSQISVVIISQNEKYELLRTLRGVQNQIIKPKEIIILNYALDDQVEEFINPYLNQNCRYIFLESVDFDFTELLRLGLKNSSSQWITFIDCYTQWFPNRLSSIQNVLIQSNCDMIFSSHICYCREKKLEIPLYRYNKVSGIMPESTVNINFTVFKKEVLVKWNQIFPIKENLDAMFLIHSSVKNKALTSVNVNELVGEEWIFCTEEKAQFYKAVEKCLEIYKHFQSEIFICGQGFAFFEFICQFFDSIYSREDLLEKFMEVTENQYLRQFLREYQSEVQQQKKEAERKLERQTSFYQLMSKWVQLGLEGKKFSDYFGKNYKNKIGIYGAGKHGRMLARCLQQEGMNVSCFIDKKLAETEVEGVSVFPLTAELPELDLIIVSPYLEFFAIEKELHQFTDVEVIPMDQLITLCGEQ